MPPVQDVIGELKRSIHTMISNMQMNISAEFRSLQESVSSLTKCVLDVEFQLSSSRTPSSTTSSGSELESSGNRRKCRIPIELQVHCKKLLFMFAYDAFCTIFSQSFTIIICK